LDDPKLAKGITELYNEQRDAVYFDPLILPNNRGRGNSIQEPQRLLEKLRERHPELNQLAQSLLNYHIQTESIHSEKINRHTPPNFTPHLMQWLQNNSYPATLIFDIMSINDDTIKPRHIYMPVIGVLTTAAGVLLTKSPATLNLGTALIITGVVGEAYSGINAITYMYRYYAGHEELPTFTQTWDAYASAHPRGWLMGAITAAGYILLPGVASGAVSFAVKHPYLTAGLTLGTGAGIGASLPWVKYWTGYQNNQPTWQDTVKGALTGAYYGGLVASTLVSGTNSTTLTSLSAISIARWTGITALARLSLAYSHALIDTNFTFRNVNHFYLILENVVRGGLEGLGARLTVRGLGIRGHITNTLRWKSEIEIARRSGRALETLLSTSAKTSLLYASAFSGTPAFFREVRERGFFPALEAGLLETFKGAVEVYPILLLTAGVYPNISNWLKRGEGLILARITKGIGISALGGIVNMMNHLIQHRLGVLGEEKFDPILSFITGASVTGLLLVSPGLARWVAPSQQSSVSVSKALVSVVSKTLVLMGAGGVITAAGTFAYKNLKDEKITFSDLAISFAAGTCATGLILALATGGLGRSKIGTLNLAEATTFKTTWKEASNLTKVLTITGGSATVSLSAYIIQAGMERKFSLPGLVTVPAVGTCLSLASWGLIRLLAHPKYGLDPNPPTTAVSHYAKFITLPVVGEAANLFFSKTSEDTPYRAGRGAFIGLQIALLFSLGRGKLLDIYNTNIKTIAAWAGAGAVNRAGMYALWVNREDFNLKELRNYALEGALLGGAVRLLMGIGMGLAGSKDIIESITNRPRFFPISSTRTGLTKELSHLIYGALVTGSKLYALRTFVLVPAWAMIENVATQWRLEMLDEQIKKVDKEFAQNYEQRDKQKAQLLSNKNALLAGNNKGRAGFEQVGGKYVGGYTVNDVLEMTKFEGGDLARYPLFGWLLHSGSRLTNYFMRLRGKTIPPAEGGFKGWIDGWLKKEGTLSRLDTLFGIGSSATLTQNAVLWRLANFMYWLPMIQPSIQVFSHVINNFVHKGVVLGITVVDEGLGTFLSQTVGEFDPANLAASSPEYKNKWDEYMNNGFIFKRGFLGSVLEMIREAYSDSQNYLWGALFYFIGPPAEGMLTNIRFGGIGIKINKISTAAETFGEEIGRVSQGFNSSVFHPIWEEGVLEQLISPVCNLLATPAYALGGPNTAMWVSEFFQEIFWGRGGLPRFHLDGYEIDPIDPNPNAPSLLEAISTALTKNGYRGKTLERERERVLYNLEQTGLIVKKIVDGKLIYELTLYGQQVLTLAKRLKEAKVNPVSVVATPLIHAKEILSKNLSEKASKQGDIKEKKKLSKINKEIEDIKTYIEDIKTYEVGYLEAAHFLLFSPEISKTEHSRYVRITALNLQKNLTTADVQAVRDYLKQIRIPRKGINYLIQQMRSNNIMFGKDDKLTPLGVALLTHLSQITKGNLLYLGNLVIDIIKKQILISDFLSPLSSSEDIEDIRPQDMVVSPDGKVFRVVRVDPIKEEIILKDIEDNIKQKISNGWQRLSFYSALEIKDTKELIKKLGDESAISTWNNLTSEERHNLARERALAQRLRGSPEGSPEIVEFILKYGARDEATKEFLTFLSNTYKNYSSGYSRVMHLQKILNDLIKSNQKDKIDILESLLGKETVESLPQIINLYKSFNKNIAKNSFYTAGVSFEKFLESLQQGYKGLYRLTYSIYLKQFQQQKKALIEYLDSHSKYLEKHNINIQKLKRYIKGAQPQPSKSPFDFEPLYMKIAPVLKLIAERNLKKIDKEGKIKEVKITKTKSLEGPDGWTTAQVTTDGVVKFNLSNFVFIFDKKGEIKIYLSLIGRFNIFHEPDHPYISKIGEQIKKNKKLEEIIQNKEEKDIFERILKKLEELRGKRREEFNYSVGVEMQEGELINRVRSFLYIFELIKEKKSLLKNERFARLKLLEDNFVFTALGIKYTDNIKEILKRANSISVEDLVENIFYNQGFAERWFFDETLSNTLKNRNVSIVELPHKEFLKKVKDLGCLLENPVSYNNEGLGGKIIIYLSKEYHKNPYRVLEHEGLHALNDVYYKLRGESLPAKVVESMRSKINETGEQILIQAFDRLINKYQKEYDNPVRDLINAIERGELKTQEKIVDALEKIKQRVINNNYLYFDKTKGEEFILAIDKLRNKEITIKDLEELPKLEKSNHGIATELLAYLYDGFNGYIEDEDIRILVWGISKYPQIREVFINYLKELEYPLPILIDKLVKEIQTIKINGDSLSFDLSLSQLLALLRAKDSLKERLKLQVNGFSKIKVMPKGSDGAPLWRKEIEDGNKFILYLHPSLFEDKTFLLPFVLSINFNKDMVAQTRILLESLQKGIHLGNGKIGIQNFDDLLAKIKEQGTIYDSEIIVKEAIRIVQGFYPEKREISDEELDKMVKMVRGGDFRDPINQIINLNNFPGTFPSRGDYFGEIVQKKESSSPIGDVKEGAEEFTDKIVKELLELK
ncbi:MAG: hypothetical protein NC826_05605, partial [Candidatus Omnitrophica bacterium]|nr:hypothetical protein [Candidatus Omnitrophota bacterium]